MKVDGGVGGNEGCVKNPTKVDRLFQSMTKNSSQQRYINIEISM